MDLLKQRLTDLWIRQGTPAFPLEAAQTEVPKGMGLTFRKPTKISGSTLMPGRYIVRSLDGGVQPDHFGIFNEDQTKLVAEINPALNN